MNGFIDCFVASGHEDQCIDSRCAYKLKVVQLIPINLNDRSILHFAGVLLLCKNVALLQNLVLTLSNVLVF